MCSAPSRNRQSLAQMIHFDPITKNCLDTTACGIAAASFVVPLPSLVSAATLVWVLLRIYEMRTVQRFLAKYLPAFAADKE